MLHGTLYVTERYQGLSNVPVPVIIFTFRIGVAINTAVKQDILLVVLG